MPCYKPLDAIRKRDGSIKVFGKDQELVNPFAPNTLRVRCGQCIGCRLDHSLMWAIRLTHEAELHDSSVFITLTYNDENLPYDLSLRKKHFQTFMKKLRKHFSGTTIRYFHCGEYGEKNFRPHYHAILYGIDFDDKTLHMSRDTHAGKHDVYTSKTLEKLWGKGFVTIGEVNMQSTAYVARYTTKKITGDQADEHYTRVDTDTGECWKVLPEYATMSRGNASSKGKKCGLGVGWLEKYFTDVYPAGVLINKNHKEMRPPRYYDNYAEQLDPEMVERVKETRELLMSYHEEDNTRERLAQRETVKLAQAKFLKRTLDGYENDSTNILSLRRES